MFALLRIKLKRRLGKGRENNNGNDNNHTIAHMGESDPFRFPLPFISTQWSAKIKICGRARSLSICIKTIK